jgi:glyoxylase-like metal-dependent hydrolase (beta-lactamase superfamily II)
MTQKLTQIAERVWFWPHHRNPYQIQPCIGIIVSDEGTVLVDVGNSPSLARQLKEALDTARLPVVSQIIYTHHHWDHVYGACEFDVPVVAHHLCREILLEESKKPWSAEYLKDEVKKNPLLKVSYRVRGRLINNWETFRIVVPEIVFDDSMVIESGDMKIMLEHVGGEHAQDSIVVKVPQAGVIFLGDCYYPPPLHLREPDSDISISMLASLEDEAYSLYVDGHSEPMTREELLMLLAQEGFYGHSGSDQGASKEVDRG